MINISLSQGRAALFGATLLLGGACSEADPAVIDSQTEWIAPLTVQVPPLQRFVVLSSVGATFGHRCIVSGGDIGVAASTTPTPNTLIVGSDSRLPLAGLLLAPRIVLGERVKAGEFGANQLIAPPSATTGPRSEFVAPPLVPTPGSVTAGGARIDVDAGRSSTLTAGRFGAVTVRGSLQLSGGLYEFQKLQLHPEARVVALADSTVRIAATLSVADRARLLPAASLLPRNVRVIVAGADGNDNSVTLGADARLSALVVAQGTVRAADRATVAGAIAARRVIFGNDARLSFDTGFECSSNSACDDAEACTLDACLDTRCANSAAADGTTCDDADPCSLGDRCLAGNCSAGTELAVTEFATGLSRPRSLVAGLDADLWLSAAETASGASDGSIARVTTAGIVTKTDVSRDLGALLLGPDGKLWVGERILGALPALGRYDTATRRFLADYTGIHVQELAASNDHGDPIIWFTGGSSVGRITPTGELLASVPTFYVTRAITAASPAPTTVLWITEANAGGFAMVGRLAFPHLQQFAVATPGELTDIVEGPDGGIWFTDPAQNELGRIAANGGLAQKFALPTAGSEPSAICGAPDGNLWVALKSANKLARVTPHGEVTEVCIPTQGSAPTQVAVGPDGNIWFLESGSGKVGRVDLAP